MGSVPAINTLAPQPNSVAPFGTVQEPLPGKVGHGSVASTRAPSPSSSTASLEDAADDSGVLARRRGCKMLCLTELIVECDHDGGSPSGKSSTSSLDTTTASGNSTRCTPFTPYMMSFSPLPRNTAMDGAVSALPDTSEPQATQTMGAPANQVAEHSVMRTSPVRHDASQRRFSGAAVRGDASQRRAPCTTGIHCAAAGLDASQRIPASGRVSLGVAIIGGDASQRSPPGCIKSVGECDAQHCFVSTCPVLPRDPSHCVSPAHDASNRLLVVSPPAANLSADKCNDMLKSWLLGSFCDSSPQSSEELAQKLLAAVPESYED